MIEKRLWLILVRLTIRQEVKDDLGKDLSLVSSLHHQKVHFPEVALTSRLLFWAQDGRLGMSWPSWGDWVKTWLIPSEHTRSESEHTRSESEHTRSGSKHTRSESEHTRSANAPNSSKWLRMVKVDQTDHPESNEKDGRSRRPRERLKSDEFFLRSPWPPFFSYIMKKVRKENIIIFSLSMLIIKLKHY